MNLSSNRLLRILRDLPAASRYLLAFSGGLDSTVLLHLLAGLGDRLPGELTALHIHHGLQADADAWGLHCRRVCEELGVTYAQIDVDLLARRGQSLEALARDARYAALAGAMSAGEMLLTAQHQDDQAETLLLQLLRGSGPMGLAGMPRLIRFEAGWLARPLLDFPRATLTAYAREHRLQWVEDPSNQDLRFDRNYIRHRVVPLLQERWPSASRTIARSARLSGELLGLADEQAEQDLLSARGAVPGTLSLPVLLDLSAARTRNLLRHWIRRRAGVVPGSRHLQRIEQECLRGRQDARPLVHWGDCEVRRFRDLLFLLRTQPPHDASQIIPWLNGRTLVLPAGIGELRLEASESGLSKVKWRNAKVEVRFRQGGELCQPAGSQHRRKLKKLFQEWGVSPWDRDRVPLIYLDGQLAAIPGYLCCEPFLCVPGDEAVLPRWIRSADPDSPSSGLVR